jgi:transposase
MSKKRYREWTLDQAYLLPPSLRDWLPDDHRVFRILEVVEQLDLVEIIDEVDSRDGRGTRPYHPRMMLALLIYGYSEGIYSSRKIARAAEERVPFRVLTANQAPHFTVINRFRDRHRGALPGLFAHLVMLCERLRLVDFSHVSIDGTKLPANASKHKAMSYGRMETELERLKEEIRRLVERAEAEDAAER